MPRTRIPSPIISVGHVTQMKRNSLKRFIFITSWNISKDWKKFGWYRMFWRITVGAVFPVPYPTSSPRLDEGKIMWDTEGGVHLQKATYCCRLPCVRLVNYTQPR